MQNDEDITDICTKEPAKPIKKTAGKYASKLGPDTPIRQRPHVDKEPPMALHHIGPIASTRNPPTVAPNALAELPTVKRKTKRAVRDAHIGSSRGHKSLKTPSRSIITCKDAHPKMVPEYSNVAVICRPANT
jgi:hypothetical protein